MRKLLLLLSVLVAIALITPNPIMADKKVKLKVGPIWNDSDAQSKCEAGVDKVAQQYSGHGVSWDGNWKTVVQGEQSECYYDVDD
jgi:hypothetical protein